MEYNRKKLIISYIEKNIDAINLKLDKISAETKLLTSELKQNQKRPSSKTKTKFNIELMNKSINALKTVDKLSQKKCIWFSLKTFIINSFRKKSLTLNTSKIEQIPRFIKSNNLKNILVELENNEQYELCHYLINQLKRFKGKQAA